ncbi:MAG TPA: hypothetical protein EYN40_05570 [Planctomycetes bacterium]|nr:hypothetical protein [Planctomycetota bacterium]
MTDDKKHDDKDRKKLSDEEMEDVAGGRSKTDLHHGSKGIRKGGGGVKKMDKKGMGGMTSTVDIDATGTTYEN